MSAFASGLAQNIVYLLSTYPAAILTGGHVQGIMTLKISPANPLCLFCFFMAASVTETHGFMQIVLHGHLLFSSWVRTCVLGALEAYRQCGFPALRLIFVTNQHHN